MELFFRNAAIAGGLLGLTLLCGLARKRPWVALIPIVGAVSCALGFHWLPAEPLTGAPVLEFTTLATWLLLGFAGRTAQPMLPRSAGMAALLGGALLGDLAAIALLAPRAPNGRTAVRMALVASAGGLLSPIGSPVTVLFASPAELAPLAALLALVAWPGGERVEGEGSAPASALLLATALFTTATPTWTPLILLGGSALMLAMGARRAKVTPVPWGALAWIGGVAVVAWSARHAGLSEQLLFGLESVEGAAWLTPALFGGAFVVAAVGGEPGGALMAASILDTTAHALPRFDLALAVGLGVGGLGPVLLSRGPWREALIPLTLQVAVALAWLMV